MTALLLEQAGSQFQLFLMVLLRLSGLMMIGPLWASVSAPMNVRVLLLITMTFLLTPTLSQQPLRLFLAWDTNANGRLERDEAPERWLPFFEARLGALSDGAKDWLSPLEFAPKLVPPSTAFDFAYTAAGEVGVGFLLGFGVHVILSALQLAGQLIDQQSGFGLGEVFNPDLNSTATQSGTLLFQLGMAIFLLMGPLGGHLQLVGALVESFESIPVGTAFLSIPAMELCQHLMTQSLMLALRVAAPLMITMSLLDLAFGFLGHSVPQINLQVAGYAIRGLVAFLLLISVIPGAGNVVATAIPTTLDALRAELGLGSAERFSPIPPSS